MVAGSEMNGELAKNVLLLKKIRTKEEKDKCKEHQKAFTKLTEDGNTHWQE